MFIRRRMVRVIYICYFKWWKKRKSEQSTNKNPSSPYFFLLNLIINKRTMSKPSQQLDDNLSGPLSESSEENGEKPWGKIVSMIEEKDSVTESKSFGEKNNNRNLCHSGRDFCYYKSHL